MNDDQLYYFLVDKNTRNVLQIEYPSDIDEFNKILGTSEGKGNLLKDLGIILNSESKVFTNPEPITKQSKVVVDVEVIGPTLSIEDHVPVEKTTKPKKKATTTKTTTPKKTKADNKPEPVKVNLFAGLFD